ncbi:MAG TPA: hypothetical protein VNK96_05265 [Fimbriimonadales bacterium]|nr:hypothetical protein [Fimbriimonadales bacterium]
MKSFVLLFSVSILSLVLATPLQVSRPDPFNVQPILDKLAEIDKANQILPLALTKEQIGKLLPKLEECRQNVRNQEKKEADRLKALDKEISQVLKDAEAGSVPPKEFLERMDKLFAAFENERNGVKIANGIILYKALHEILNPGQKKIIVQVVDQIYDVTLKQWKEGTEEAKIQFYALTVLMDDAGYKFLVKLNRSAK